MSITPVSDLCSWQVYIYFKKEILEAVEFAEGPFLQSHGETIFDGDFDNNYNATHGELWMYCLRGWTGYGVDGYGTLATVTFKAKLGGTSPVILANTILGNSTAQRISHTTTDGTVYVGGHNVAIISVVPCKTIVGQGYSMKINVTAENQGDETVTFNVTAYADTTSIATQAVILTSGNSTTIIFIWDTSGFAKGNYTVWAYATPVEGETDTADNTCTADRPIFVGIPGDVNGDNKVDLKDVYAVAKAYGSFPGHLKWNPVCDINNDNKVDLKDYYTTCKNYGKVDP